MRRPLFTGCLLLTLAGAAFTQSNAPPNPQPSTANVQPPSQAPAAQAPDAAAKANDAKPEAKSDASKTDTSKADASTPDANKAESDKSAASKAEASKKAEKKESDRGPEHLAQCLKDWDRGTHMTRQEWARTCRRVVGNRVRFLREQGQ